MKEIKDLNKWRDMLCSWMGRKYSKSIKLFLSWYTGLTQFPSKSQKDFCVDMNKLILKVIWREKVMAPHSSTLAWRIPWVEEPGRCSPWGRYKSDTTERLHFSLSCIGEGNGNPLQCSCLENPRDEETWWAAVYGVAQSRTWLKWLSSSIQVGWWKMASLNFQC